MNSKLKSTRAVLSETGKIIKKVGTPAEKKLMDSLRSINRDNEKMREDLKLLSEHGFGNN